MQFKDLIKELATRSEITQSQAKDIYNHLVDIVTQQVTEQDGGEISLPRFVSLSRSIQPGRTGRNPATGESVEIPERYRLRAVPNSALKRSVKELPL